MQLRIPLFRGMTLRDGVAASSCFEETYKVLWILEDKGSSLFRNVGIRLPRYAASCPSRTEFHLNSAGMPSVPEEARMLFNRNVKISFILIYLTVSTDLGDDDELNPLT